MKTTFLAPDIECDGCTGSIEKALGAAEGVTSVTADVSTKLVAVDFDDTKTSELKIAELLDEIGFPATRHY